MAHGFFSSGPPQGIHRGPRFQPVVCIETKTGQPSRTCCCHGSTLMPFIRLLTNGQSQPLLRFGNALVFVTRIQFDVVILSIYVALDYEAYDEILFNLYHGV